MTDTIPQKILDTILQALRNSRGDDYARACAAFRTYSPARMSLPYGESKQTPNEILAAYKEYERLADQAIEWVQKISAPHWMAEEQIRREIANAISRHEMSGAHGDK